MPRIALLVACSILAGCYEWHRNDLPPACDEDAPTLVFDGGDDCVQMEFDAQSVRPLCSASDDIQGSFFRVVNLSSSRVLVRAAAPDGAEVHYGEYQSDVCTCGSQTHTRMEAGMRCFAAWPVEAGAQTEKTISTSGQVRVEACPIGDDPRATVGACRP